MTSIDLLDGKTGGKAEIGFEAVNISKKFRVLSDLVGLPSEPQNG